MIVFEKVSKKYPLGNFALQNISFKLEDNDFVFLVGPSGAGKTTILRLILGEYPPSAGTIMVDNLDISDKKFNQFEALRRRIGFVFQDFKVLADKNVFENIALALKVIDIMPEKIEEEVKKALELVGLKNKEQVFPIQLSAGELQRIAIARAIVGNRDIILADEPTGNLDPKTAWEIMKIFKKLDGKRTIIIATHNTDIVNSLKKRVIYLKEGKIINDHHQGGYDL
jgi:cell division transport system ATP-binding protein